MGNSHIEINTNGAPVYAFREGGSILVTAKNGTGTKSNPKEPKETIGSVIPNKNESRTGRDWVPWGTNDKFPDEILAEIRKSGVASAALRLNNYKLFGQQVIPVVEEGLDDNLQMKYKLVKDPEISMFLKRSNYELTRFKIIQDYNYFANSFPMLLLNEDRSKVVKIGHDKARKFRYAPFDQKTGRVELAYRSANFPNPSDDKNDREEIAVINSSDWYEEYERIKFADQGLKYVFPTYYPDPQYDYYSLASWDGVRSNGWLEISNSIPEYKRAIFKNQSSIKYHVQIPMSYWRAKYNKWDSMGYDEKTKAVNEQLDEMDEYLTGSENAMKTFVSFFEVNKVTGKAEDGIIITSIDDKLKNEAYLPDGAAANTEILFSMLVNPAIFGLGVPGGSYGGANQGGSDIRESWMIMNAINNADRAILHQIFDFVREYNGWNPDLKLITLDKVLTTTDTGRGSKIVS